MRGLEQSRPLSILQLTTQDYVYLFAQKNPVTQFFCIYMAAPVILLCPLLKKYNKQLKDINSLRTYMPYLWSC